MIRLRDDGTVPPDNPFIGRSEFKPAIYTLGHRNGHALVVNPETGELWATEQGPNGGDEINIIKAGPELRLADGELRPQLSRSTNL